MGVYYNRARYYDQSIGRFTQMDTWEGKDCTPITLNKYLYANGNPVTFYDPSGEMTIAGIMAGINGHAILQNRKQVDAMRQVQNIVSKLCKNVSQLAGFPRIHHSFPVFMGNTRKNNRGDVYLDDYIHTELHTLIDLMFLINDLPHPKSPKSGGRKGFQRLFNSSRDDWKKALRVIKDVSEFVDKTCDPITPNYDPVRPKIETAMKVFGVYK